MSPSPYDTLWAHIDECAECDRDLRRLCKTGQALFSDATSTTVARIAPMPWVLAKGRA